MVESRIFLQFQKSRGYFEVIKCRHLFEYFDLLIKISSVKLFEENCTRKPVIFLLNNFIDCLPLFGILIRKSLRV